MYVVPTTCSAQVDALQNRFFVLRPATAPLCSAVHSLPSVYRDFRDWTENHLLEKQAKTYLPFGHLAGSFIGMISGWLLILGSRVWDSRRASSLLKNKQKTRQETLPYCLLKLLCRSETGTVPVSVKFYWNTPRHILLHVVRGCLQAERLNGVVATQSKWSVKPKIITAWPFTENVCWSLI